MCYLMEQCAPLGLCTPAAGSRNAHWPSDHHRHQSQQLGATHRLCSWPGSGILQLFCWENTNLTNVSWQVIFTTHQTISSCISSSKYILWSMMPTLCCFTSSGWPQSAHVWPHPFSTAALAVCWKVRFHNIFCISEGIQNISPILCSNNSHSSHASKPISIFTYEMWTSEISTACGDGES